MLGNVRAELIKSEISLTCSKSFIEQSDFSLKKSKSIFVPNECFHPFSSAVCQSFVWQQLKNFLEMRFQISAQTLRQLRKFLFLVRNYARMAAPLTALTLGEVSVYFCHNFQRGNYIYYSSLVSKPSSKHFFCKG